MVPVVVIVVVVLLMMLMGLAGLVVVVAAPTQTMQASRPSSAPALQRLLLGRFWPPPLLSRLWLERLEQEQGLVLMHIIGREAPPPRCPHTPSDGSRRSSSLHLFV